MLIYYFVWAGISVYVYALSRLISKKVRRLSEDDRAPIAQNVLHVVAVILMVLALPATIVMFPIELSEEMRHTK